MSSRTQSFSRSSSNSYNSSSSENLPPRAMARVAREVRDLMKKSPEGTKLILDSESLGEINAEIEGPVGTPYASRFFQLKLVLPGDFPNSPPRGFFLTKIYHPNVDMSTGAICVNTLKKDWNSSVSLGHVLSVIRCLLIVPFPESSLNDEAGKLFMESYDEFEKRAKIMTNVHGRPTSSVVNKDSPTSPSRASSTSPMKGGGGKSSKENEIEFGLKVRNSKSTSGSSTTTTTSTSNSTILKQSNSSDRNIDSKNGGSVAKVNRSSMSKSRTEKKKKSKRNLNRL